MRLSIVMPLAVAVALAGCGKKEEAAAGGAGAAVSGDTAAVTPAGIGLKPGQYTATVELLEMTVPGMPAGMAKDALKRAKPTTFTYCVTPEQAEQSVKQMLGKAQSGSCSFKKYEISGGHISTEMTCKGADGRDGTIKTEGTIASDGISTVAEAQFPNMSMKSRSTFKRTGDCTQPQ